MDHLFNSVVQVQRLQLSNVNGVATMTWQQATDDDPVANEMLSYLKCRLDMNFLRPGKDVVPAPEAGRVPDRIGVMFTYPYAPIKGGDRLVTIDNMFGKQPVQGTFEIRTVPDEAIDYSDRHHLEVQIIEVNQAISAATWPDDEFVPYEEN